MSRRNQSHGKQKRQHDALRRLEDNKDWLNWIRAQNKSEINGMKRTKLAQIEYEIMALRKKLNLS